MSQNKKEEQPMDRTNDRAVLARRLARAGEGGALEVVFATLEAANDNDEVRRLIDRLVGASAVTSEQLERVLDDGSDEERRLAAEVLGRRGVERGWRVLFEDFASRTLADEYIAKGPEGIALMCRSFDVLADFDETLVKRMAQRRATTEATLLALACDAQAGGELAALRTLGFWDAPHVVELLMRVAEDPARRREAREEALEALCRLEAPEAIDVIGRGMLDAELCVETRLTCAEALGAIGNIAGRAALEEAARCDLEGRVGEEARRVLERFVR